MFDGTWKFVFLDDFYGFYHWDSSLVFTTIWENMFWFTFSKHRSHRKSRGKCR